MGIIFNFLDIGHTFAKRSYTEQSFIEAFTNLYLILSNWIKDPSYQQYLNYVGQLISYLYIKVYFDPSEVEGATRSVLTTPFLQIKDEMDTCVQQYPSFSPLVQNIYTIVNEIIDTSLVYLHGME